MITCETPHRMWTVEGKIEGLPGSYGEGLWAGLAHAGIDDLSRLLAKHVGKWAKVRVELIEGPSPRPEVDELKRMRSLVKEVRERLATRATRAPATATLEEECIESLAETMLVLCDRIEELNGMLRGGK